MTVPSKVASDLPAECHYLIGSGRAALVTSREDISDSLAAARPAG